MRVPVSN